MSALSSIAVLPIVATLSPSIAEGAKDLETAAVPPPGAELLRKSKLTEMEAQYPGYSEITRRAEELNKITPHLVPSLDGRGWIGSSDSRWRALYEDARELAAR